MKKRNKKEKGIAKKRESGGKRKNEKERKAERHVKRAGDKSVRIEVRSVKYHHWRNKQQRRIDRDKIDR